MTVEHGEDDPAHDLAATLVRVGAQFCMNFKFDISLLVEALLMARDSVVAASHKDGAELLEYILDISTASRDPHVRIIAGEVVQSAHRVSVYMCGGCEHVHVVLWNAQDKPIAEAVLSDDMHKCIVEKRSSQPHGEEYIPDDTRH